MIRGLPEVPMGISDPQMRRWAVDMRECVKSLVGTFSPPSPPTNVKVTPQAFGNLIQWTRGLNSDYHEVLIGSTPNIGAAVVQGVGNSAQYFDQVGQVGIKRFYWVRAHKNTGARSPEVATGAATTLASGTGVNPPPAPPATQDPARNTRTGHIDPRTHPGQVNQL